MKITFELLSLACKHNGSNFRNIFRDENSCNHSAYTYHHYREGVGYINRSDQPCSAAICPLFNQESPKQEK